MNLREKGQSCTGCWGAGWYYAGDWSQGYPKRRCDVCKGSGRMTFNPKTKEYEAVK